MNTQQVRRRSSCESHANFDAKVAELVDTNHGLAGPGEVGTVIGQSLDPSGAEELKEQLLAFLAGAALDKSGRLDLNQRPPAPEAG